MSHKLSKWSILFLVAVVIASISMISCEEKEIALITDPISIEKFENEILNKIVDEKDKTFVSEIYSKDEQQGNYAIKKPLKEEDREKIINILKSTGYGQVSEVMFNKASGNHPQDIEVELTTSTEGAKIYYAIGEKLVDAYGRISPSATEYSNDKKIIIKKDEGTKTIRAIAVKDGMMNSVVSKRTYIVSDKGGIYYPLWLTPNINFLPGFLNKIHWYGLMYVCVAITAYVLIRLQIKGRKDVTRDNVDYIFIWAVVGAILGARLAHAIFIEPRLWTEPWKIILPFDFVDGKPIFTGIAGMSFYGGIFGVILSVWLYCRVKKINFRVVGDFLAAAFPLGYTFGRLGNFFNQEFRGTEAPDWLPWKMFYWDNNYLGDKVYEEAAKHPSQLYEALGQGILLWVVLWFIVKPRKPWDGFMMGAFVGGYGITRFITEFFRSSSPKVLFETITVSHLVCFGLVIVGVIIMLITRVIDKRSPKKA